MKRTSFEGEFEGELRGWSIAFYTRELYRIFRCFFLMDNIQVRPAFVAAASAATGIALGFVVSRVIQSLSSKETRHSASKCHLEDLPDAAVLLEAASFSAEKHQDQRRKNAKQQPYICHPIRVARRLAVDGSVTDVNVLVAALLHDTVEDTDTTLEEIEALFGATVANIVDEVSDDKTLPKDERKRQQIEHAPCISPEAKLVKLGDKLDNLTDLLTETPLGWRAERVAQYFEWAEKVIQGLRGTNDTLEDNLDRVLGQKHKAVEAATGSAIS